MDKLKALEYRYNMAQRDFCTGIALRFLKSKDTYMFSFWANAAREFERRAYAVE